MLVQRTALGGCLLLVVFARAACGQLSIPIVNSSFESGLLGQTPSGWSVTVGNMYLSSGLSTEFDPDVANSGSRFVTATWQATGASSSPFPAGQSMGIFQTVDLSDYASLIDGGNHALQMAFAYNDADSGDFGEVSVEFLDAESNPFEFAGTFSSLNAGTGRKAWKVESLSHLVPVGSRSMRITLLAEANGGGTARNVGFDDLSASLVVYAEPPPRDIVHGTLIQFNPNGAWSWYQDERAVVDKAHGELIIGSTASFAGLGGQSVDGQIHTTHFNLDSSSRTVHVHNDIESYGSSDDHNVPGLIVKQNGDLLAFYAAHNGRTSDDGSGGLDDRSYYRTYDTASSTWGLESEYHWWPVIPDNAPGGGGTTYSNLFQLSSEDSDGDGNGRLYNIARTQQSPHIMYSDDNGATWNYGGQLTEQPAVKPAGNNYVNGYYKYVSNGVDRIDLLATEYHPRDFNTSIYHAYMQNGKMYDSLGNEIDNDIFDAADSFDSENVTSTDDFTPVFLSDGLRSSRAWNTDIQTYDDGTITALFKVRPSRFTTSEVLNNEDHRVWFARFDPMTRKWTAHEIAKAGARLFADYESDYTGLGALDPGDPNTVYISTDVSPISNMPTDHHEIYKGVTADGGVSWTWDAITERSTYDNLRPIVPAWDGDHTALIWWKGTMVRSQEFDTAVVGVVFENDKRLGSLHYVDANPSNTTLASGDAMSTTSGVAPGDEDNLWHIRSEVGNAATVFTADESASENPPIIKTTVFDLTAGTYDVFAYFWADASSDWQIRAGLLEDDLMKIRDRGAQGVAANSFENLVLVQEGSRQLMQAYLGRKSVDDGESLSVFVDDSSGSNLQRVWYDGIGYAPVNPVKPGDFDNDGDVDGHDFLSWQRGESPHPLSAADLADWQANYGSIVSVSEAATGRTAVPEPTTALLTAIGISLMWYFT
jgi:hypothetical protein